MANKDFNKGGRTKLAKSKNRKANKILLYLNDEEMVKFNKMFTQSMFKERSPFIREILLEGKFEILYRDKTRDEMLYELGKVATNLNQIAHRLNIDNARNLTGEDVDVLKGLREILLHYKF